LRDAPLDLADLTGKDPATVRPCRAASAAGRDGLVACASPKRRRYREGSSQLDVARLDLDAVEGGQDLDTLGRPHALVGD
jgi:hypothetical protein